VAQLQLLLFSLVLIGCGAAKPGAGGHADLGSHLDLAPAADFSTGCGACPSGYQCSSANGRPVCRAPSGVPLFSHVFVIVMENTSLKTLTAANNVSFTPYLTELAKSGATHGDYHGVAHPSLPNYIAMISGGTQGIGCDCDPTGSACNIFTCNLAIHACGCSQKAAHVGDQLIQAGKSWRAYGESMMTPCNLTNASPYATRHLPFLYFDDVVSDMQGCKTNVVDYSQFSGDLASPPALAFVAPNLTDDMHDPFPAGSQNLANGDKWLANEVPAILGSDAYKQGGVLFIVWDEDDLSGPPLGAADDPIPLFVLSPLAKSNGFVGATHADHYSLLATIEDGLGLGRLGQAAQATPLVEFFPAE
jgi:hypothetical protein